MDTLSCKLVELSDKSYLDGFISGIISTLIVLILIFIIGIITEICFKNETVITSSRPMQGSFGWASPSLDIGNYTDEDKEK